MDGWREQKGTGPAFRPVKVGAGARSRPRRPVPEGVARRAKGRRGRERERRPPRIQLTLCRMNRPQLTHRVAPEMVRDVLSQFRNRMISADEAAERLGLSRSGLYKLYTK